jgi:hypothetical protein
MVGLGLIVVSCYSSYRTARISSYLFKNYENLYKSPIDLKTLIKNPGHEEHTTLSNLTCMPSPELFKEHMSYVDRLAIGSAQEFCFKQPCDDFIAEINSNNEKY